jgi:outer membrane protein OmpA-like peptidoglycan-associated protein
MEEHYEDDFGLSVGDVMSALLLVFVLLLLAIITSFTEKVESSNKFFDKQTELYEALNDKFQEKFDSNEWEGIIESDGTIVFDSPTVLFNAYESSLKRDFKLLLNEFYPSYIEVLTRDEFKEFIKEIRVEGHTSSFYKGTIQYPCSDPYICNLELSQNRSLSVVRYLLRSLIANKTVENLSKQWFQNKSVAVGFSSSKPIIDKETGREDKYKSRRVTFKPLLDAEHFLKNIK